MTKGFPFLDLTPISICSWVFIGMRNPIVTCELKQVKILNQSFFYCIRLYITYYSHLFGGFALLSYLFFLFIILLNFIFCLEIMNCYIKFFKYYIINLKISFYYMYEKLYYNQLRHHGSPFYTSVF